MSSRTLKGIFFDLGGTLVTAYPSVADHILQSLAEFGHPLPHRDIAAALTAVPPRFEQRGWSLSHERSFAFWTEHYRELLRELAIPPSDRETITLRIYKRLSRPQGYGAYSDAIPVLERLAREGFTLGLISNWEAWGMDLIKHLGMHRYFPTQVLSGCVGMEKPDTQIFKLALQEANIAAEQVVYVGDSVQFDIEPARAIGMRAVLIDRHTARDETDATTIRSLRELHSHELLHA